MSTETLQLIRNAEISQKALKLSVTDKKSMEQVKAYVELMDQQRKPLSVIRVTRDFPNGVMKSVNAGLQVEDRYSGATYKGIPLAVANG